MTWCLYIIETHKKQLYVGITTDVSRRFQEHLDTFNKCVKARGAKFFRGQAPVRLALVFECVDRSEASRLEYRLKQLSADQKRALIAQGMASLRDNIAET